MNWITENGFNSTTTRLQLGDQMELSLTKNKNVKDDLYLYSLRWGTGHEYAPMNCYQKENLIANNWDEAKSKAIQRSKYIINSYIHELNLAVEVMNNGTL